MQSKANWYREQAEAFGFSAHCKTFNSSHFLAYRYARLAAHFARMYLYERLERVR